MRPAPSAGRSVRGSIWRLATGRRACDALLMAKKKGAPLSELTWSIREVVDPGTPVGAVACVLGRIMIGGEGIFRVMPGSWDVQVRKLPEGVGFPLSIALEPRPPFRVAVGAESGDVLIFTDTSNATSITGHPFTEVRGAKRAEQLAWVVNDGESTLFARTDDSSLYGMKAEGWARLEVPPVRAIACDDAGGFAALCLIEGQPRVYTTCDGGTVWRYRSLELPVAAEPNAPAALALAGEALALSIGDSGIIIDRGEDAETERIAGFDRAYALAFQGSREDAWLYVGLQRRGEDPAAVWLLDDAGEMIKVMDFLCEDQDPLDLGPLAWDATRGALMVSSRAGLLALGPEAPKKKRAPRVKKPLLQ